MLSGKTKTKEISKAKIVSARLRGLADKLLYIFNDKSVFYKLELYLKNALTLDESSIETYILMAKSYQLYKCHYPRNSQSIDSKIVEILTHALQYDNLNTDVRMLLASLFMDRNEYNIAIDYLKDILELRKESLLFELAGKCYFELGKVNNALGEYSKALKLQPKNHRVHANKGCVFLSMGDYASAYHEALCSELLNPKYKAATDLKKLALKSFFKSKGIHTKDLQKDFENQIDNIKNTLFQSEFEKDNLTGFANEESLKLWSDQSVLSSVYATCINFCDIRVSSIIYSALEVNQAITSFAENVHNLLNDAIFLSRPKSDKILVFSAYDYSGKLNELEDLGCKYMVLGGIKVGFSPEGTILTAMSEAIVNSIKD